MYLYISLVYIVGTYLGYRFAWSRALAQGATKTLDMLESEGYLRTRRRGNEVELIKIEDK